MRFITKILDITSKLPISIPLARSFPEKSREAAKLFLWKSGR